MAQITYSEVCKFVRQTPWVVCNSNVYSFSCDSGISESESSHVHLMRNVFIHRIGACALLHALVYILSQILTIFGHTVSECMWKWTHWSMQPYMPARSMERFMSCESACGFRLSLDVSLELEWSLKFQLTCLRCSAVHLYYSTTSQKYFPSSSPRLFVC